MAQPEAAVQRLALTNWKDTRRGGDPAVAHDHAAVMKRSFGVKNCQNKLDRKIAVHRHTRLFVNANRSVAFDGDECTELFVGELANGLGDVMHSFTLLTG